MTAAVKWALVPLLLVPAMVLVWHGNDLVKAEILLADARKLLQLGSEHYAYEKAAESARRSPLGYEYHVIQYRAAYRSGKHELALKHAREGVQLSAASAKGWLRLAWVKARLREFDAEYNQALRNAFRFGKHLDAHQFRVVRLGVLTLKHLDAEMQARLGESLAYLLNHQLRYRLIAFLFEKNQEQLICPVYARSDEIKEWCTRTAKFREICSHRHGNSQLIKWCAERGIGKNPA